MKVIVFLSVCAGVLVAMFGNGYPLSIVRHRWQEIIVESNHAALRPGSVYDILTHFEQNSGISRPQFNYFFFDTGLGAADPIYPVFQTGYQASWPQLIKAGLSEENRHIDHFSTGDTPEGCRIQSVYWVRHVDEFPDMYQDLRKAGYTLVDISFDYYSKLRPDAQCGKHKAHEFDAGFDPFAAIYPYATTFKTLADVPPALLAKYEAKVGVLKLVTQNFKTSSDHWASYAQSYNLADNSMWFYPNGFAPDYGIDAARTQSGLMSLTRPKDLVYEGNAYLQGRFALSHVLPAEDFSKLLSFWKGKPTPNYDASRRARRRRAGHHAAGHAAKLLYLRHNRRADPRCGRRRFRSRALQARLRDSATERARERRPLLGPPGHSAGPHGLSAHEPACCRSGLRATVPAPRLRCRRPNAAGGATPSESGGLFAPGRCGGPAASEQTAPTRPRRPPTSSTPQSTRARCKL